MNSVVLDLLIKMGTEVCVWGGGWLSQENFEILALNLAFWRTLCVCLSGNKILACLQKLVANTPTAPFHFYQKPVETKKKQQKHLHVPWSHVYWL